MLNVSELNGREPPQHEIPYKNLTSPPMPAQADVSVQVDRFLLLPRIMSRATHLTIPLIAMGFVAAIPIQEFRLIA
jgi:hypothetical protein